MTEVYREESRKDYYSPEKEDANIEQINCGSLQRIADATEAMSQNHVRLQNQRDSFERRYRNERAENQRLAKSNAALRGHMGRLKRKIQELEGKD